MLASGKLRPTYWRAPDTTRSTRMLGISDCVEQLVESWDPAAILGWSVSFARDVARV